MRSHVYSPDVWPWLARAVGTHIVLRRGFTQRFYTPLWYSYTHLLHHLTFPFLSYSTLAGCFALCCDRAFSLGRPTHSHLPASPGEGFWEGLPACRLSSGLRLAAYVSSARVQVGTFFTFFRQPVVCITFMGRVLAARAGPLYVKTLIHKLYILYNV
jgi:hypothetical protein